MARIEGFTEDDLAAIEADFALVVQRSMERVCARVAESLKPAVVAAGQHAFHLPGQHNQASHGAGGGHELPPGWTVVPHDEAVARYSKNRPHMSKYQPGEAEKRLSGSTTYAFGDHHVIVDDAGSFSQEQMDDMFSTVEDLTSTFPSRGGPATFLIGDQHFSGHGPSVMGHSKVGSHNDISIRPSVLRGTHPGAGPDRPASLMPAGRDPGVTQFRYTATHEYGHGMQPRLGGTKLQIVHAQQRKHLNKYGNKSPEEGFAEAFTEWSLSGGMTSNDAAIGYANAYGW